MSFAQSTGSRFGAAVNVERIEPVEYSALIRRTPRTAIASWATFTPASAISSGWRSARSCGDIVPQCEEVTKAKTIGNAIVSRKPAASDHFGDRTERSFVHSETSTRWNATCPLPSRRGRPVAGAIAFMRPRPASRRRTRARLA
jgi:hypothetical protein